MHSFVGYRAGGCVPVAGVSCRVATDAEIFEVVDIVVIFSVVEVMNVSGIQANAAAFAFSSGSLFHKIENLHRGPRELLGSLAAHAEDLADLLISESLDFELDCLGAGVEIHAKHVDKG